MAAETLSCQFHQYGYCKFGLNCRKYHTRDTCPNPYCSNNTCRLRHPKQCKFFVVNGRCKFAENCSFRHVSNEEIIKVAVEKELGAFKEEIIALKLVNEKFDNQIHEMNEKMKKLVESEAQKSDLCDNIFVSNDIFNEHEETIHEESQLSFKCDLCDYKSKSQKGVNIHKGSKHKSSSTSSTSPSQTPINCILQDEGCQSIVTSYYSKYTAICNSCKHLLAEKLKSTPFSHDLCPCCHKLSRGPPLSLCNECVEDIHTAGWTDSPWGSWHLDRFSGEIICIDLDFT